MSDIRWDLLQPVDVGAHVQQGFATGMAMVKQIQRNNALRAYVANPDDQGAFNALAGIDPEAAFGIQDRRARQMQLQQKAQEEAEQKRQQNIVLGGRILKQVQPKDEAGWQQALQLAHEAGVDITNAPPNYNPEFVQRIIQASDALDPQKPATPPSAIQEYEYAKSQGYQGSFMEWQSANAPMMQVDLPNGQKQFFTRNELDALRRGGAPPPPQTQSGGGYYPPAQGGFDAAVEHVLGNEGGYAPSDMNGAPVNFGINQGANPDVNVKSLTRDRAKQLYYERYWKPSGAESLPPNMQAPYFDIYIRNPKKAKEALAASGGDPTKFMQITSGYFQQLAQTEKGQKYGRAWANRDAKNLAIATGIPHASSKAEVDALPPGAEFIAPDGSHRRKPGGNNFAQQLPVGSTADSNPYGYSRF